MNAPGGAPISPPITIAVMARVPVAGRCKTRLAKGLGLEAAARLYEAMLFDRLAAVDALDVAGRELRRVILAAPEDDGVAVLTRRAPPGWEVVPQRGGDLGERLASGLRDLFQPGHLVCLVDSDSPTLPLALIHEQLRASPRGRRVVLGPCQDGGYYLIGLDALELRVFENIPWSSERVLEVTIARCRELGLEVEELMTWFDIDEPEDVVRLERDLAEQPNLAPRTASLLQRLREERH